MLEIKGLKKSFKAKEVLKNLNLSIKEGVIVCLLGNNGAGKTSLINCILRMIQADAGSILLDGRDIFTYKNEEYFSKVNALLESSVNVYDYLTGWQNISGKNYFFNQDVVNPTYEWNAADMRWDYVITSSRPYGSMYENEKTPDGFLVNANGERLQ